MEEKLVSPISTDEKLPLKDLSSQNKMTGAGRDKKEVKKKTFRYYAVLGALMIILVFFGLFFGFYLRSRNQTPGPVPAGPTPSLVEEKPEASPATTLEVIKEKTGIIDDKLNQINLYNNDSLPPQLDYDLSVLVEDLEEE